MHIDDLLVEVRAASLERVGAILKADLQLEAEIPFNGVGTWTVTISREHPLAEVLSSPGGGIVVTNLANSEVMFSGPTVQPEEARSAENISGEIVVQGITDDHVLDDALAWPDPISGDATAQVALNDERSGNVEAVIHGYVAANIGMFAPVNRKHPRLIMGEQSGLGAVVETTARFDKLLTICQNLALPYGIGFRVRQHGSRLRFETFMPRDQRRLVRLSLENDGLANSRLATAAPTLTRAIVAGKPGAEGVAQLVREVTDSGSREAETQWGRRIERFVDQQDTRNTDTMTHAGREALKDGGFTSANARFEPTATFRAMYGAEWDLGDTVSIESGGKTYTAPVTALIFKLDASDGFRLGAILGDPSLFSQFASLNAAAIAAQKQQEEDATKPPPNYDEAMEELDRNLDELYNVTLPALNAALEENDAALLALDSRLAANDVALEQVGQTANGKNSVRYETFAPFNESNVAGDIWYVRDAATQRITAQYEGLGGTSWRSVTLTNIVVTTMDAGAITSGSISAARLVSTQINASNITTGTLDASQLTVKNINAGSITAGTINGSVVNVINLNAANITTGQISADHIDLNSLNGRSITGATINTATSGQRVQMNASTQSLRFYDSNNIAVGTMSADLSSGIYASGTLRTDGLNNTGLTTLSGNVTILGDITGATTSELTIGGNIHCKSLWSDELNDGTITPARISAQGRLIRDTTSSITVKENVEPLAIDHNAVCDIETVTFNFKDREEYGDRRYIGVIAEQVSGLGLEQLVLRNRDGEITGFMYQELSVVLLEIVKELRSDINEIKSQLAA